MRRWLWWLTPPWGAKVRRRQALEVLQRWQEEERAAARARLMGVAAILDQPTTTLPTVRPLLTRGQAARSEQARP